MITAMLFHRTSKLRSGTVTPETILDTILQLTITYHQIFKTVTITLSLGLLSGFCLLTRRSPDKEDYNWWQPYISFIPILSFITLRNSHRLLRNHHSELFAWLGRCSLETYVLQYHIWLAGDTTGLLRLGLWNKWAEAAILTPIFLWASWAISVATQVLTNWIVHGSTPNTSFSLVDEKAKASPGLLPRAMKDKHVALVGEGGWGYRYIGRFRDDLRWRLGLIGLVMWVANVTYT